MQKLRILLLAGLFVVLGLGVYYVSTKAQSSNNGLQIHPSNFDITLSPGATTEQTITFDNLTNKDVALKVDRRNFTAEGEEGGVELTTENTPFSLASWISVKPETITVPAHKSQKFTFIVAAPGNAEAGGHFGSIVFATIPPKASDTNGAALSQEVSSLILVKITGNIQEKAIVQSLTTDKSFYESGPVTFDLRVKNESNVHIQPFGSIEVTDMLGQKFDAPLELRNVLPGAVRKIPAILNKKLLIGKYTARLIASYGTKNQPLYGSVTFYAFPVRYAAIILVVTILLIIMRKRIIRALKVIITGK